jgi:hypothetical protein
MFIVPPSIDPLSPKNSELSEHERIETLVRYGIDPERPMLLQVSRFDRFKDPLGVIAAYRILKPYYPQLQLVLAGGPADDDPEGAEVLREVLEQAGDDRDLKVLMLPPDSHVIINALQRSAIVVLQKSLREGFGLTVTEALWKGKPVVGGATGGIALQVHDYHTGFLVHSPEGAAVPDPLSPALCRQARAHGPHRRPVRARAFPADAAPAGLPHRDALPGAAERTDPHGLSGALASTSSRASRTRSPSGPREPVRRQERSTDLAARGRTYTRAVNLTHGRGPRETPLASELPRLEHAGRARSIHSKHANKGARP